MPWYDLQFWAVTGFAIAALAQIVRPFLAQDSSPCGGCAIGKAACQAPRVEGRSPLPPNHPHDPS